MYLVACYRRQQISNDFLPLRLVASDMIAQSTNLHKAGIVSEIDHFVPWHRAMITPLSFAPEKIEPHFEACERELS